ncbi:MAG TPA: HAD-IA family hydrolase [Acidobacteriaceae bacterium]|nr:HAD-IA family hydrolase [Acidobacteriaceae bacterium]
MAHVLENNPVVLHPRGILFDMDGVLVSSIGSVERTWEKWSQARGIDPQLAIRVAHGCRAIEVVRQLRPDLDAAAEVDWLEAEEMEDKVGVEMLAGVRRILDVLPPHCWTVVTSATERLARGRLAHAGILVPETIVSADMVTQGKPHPEPYRMGAQLLGLEPSECLVIEDSSAGATAGRAAGCMVLATLFSHALESLRDAGWIVPSLEDVAVAVRDDRLEVRFVPVATAAAARN